MFLRRARRASRNKELQSPFAFIDAIAVEIKDMLTPDSPIANDACHCWRLGMERRKMKIIPSIAVLTVLAAGARGLGSLCAAEPEGVALAIVYDTSGSMKDVVHDKHGKSSPKFVIANRALTSVAGQIQNFITNSPDGKPRKVDAALFIFSGENATAAIPLGPFDATALQNWAASFRNPAGGTPLGNAVNAAARAVLDSPLPRKHVLVITDGVNTQGPQPSSVIPSLKNQAERNHSSVAFHFIAFDVDAKVFDPVKKLGATVVSAADEAQLNTQVDFILQRKILLEDEEPAKKK
jgi:hypothetical protein